MNIRSIFSIRNLAGTLLFLILVGEPTVAFSTGLYTPQGFFALFILYFLLFLLYESLIFRYQLVNYQIALLTFAVYAVAITGFFNKEITEYIFQPENIWIITMIRIQSSLFPIFAFYLLNKFTAPDKKAILPIKWPLILLLSYMALLSMAKLGGFSNVIYTFQTAPILSLIFLALGCVALFFIFRKRNYTMKFSSKIFTALSLILFVISLIPSLIAFVLLVFLMPIVFIIYLFNKNFRNNFPLQV